MTENLKATRNKLNTYTYVCMHILCTYILYVCWCMHVGAAKQVESEHTEETDNNHGTPVIISKRY